MHCISIGILSVTQCQGMISIIPKGNKPREFLKNWRPISLLNISYKILSSCLANHLKSTITNLIHENQKGFLPGRYIGETIRLLNIIYYTDEYHTPGQIILIDFEKAFDSISWKLINHTLSFF